MTRFISETRREASWCLLMTRKTCAIYAELPVAIGTPMNLNYYYFNQVPTDIGALFVIPTVRANIFSRRLGYAVGERGRRLRSFSGIFDYACRRTQTWERLQFRSGPVRSGTG